LSSSDGLTLKLKAFLFQQMTPEEKKAKFKAYYEANKEKFKQYAKANYEKNSQKLIDYSRQYRKDNNEKVRKYNLSYRNANKIAIKKQVSEYKAKNKVSISEYSAKYNAKNKEAKSAYNADYHEKRKQDPDFLKRKSEVVANYRKTPQGKAVKSASEAKRRAVKHNAPIGEITAIKTWIKGWRSELIVKCHWCNVEFHPDNCHADHVMPIAKGGAHELSNLVISCKGCNLKKQAKHPDKWMAQIGCKI